jgi:thiamine phosphate synthase YjbQ (UPF0047 family)
VEDIKNALERLAPIGIDYAHDQRRGMGMATPISAHPSWGRASPFLSQSRI